MMREIRDQLASMNTNMLTTGMFALYQAGTDRRFVGIESDIADEKAARAKEVGKVEARMDEQDKFKRGVWASIGVAVLVALLSVVLSLVRISP